MAAGSESQGLLAYQLGSDASGCELLHIPGGGTREPLTPESIVAGRQFMHMDGRAVFKWAVNQISRSVRLVLEESQLQPADLDFVVLHQANRRILDAAVEALGLSPEKIAINLDRFGNTSAASIPLVLDELARSGRLRPGSRVLFSGFGAGLAWGTGVFQW